MKGLLSSNGLPVKIFLLMTFHSQGTYFQVISHINILSLDKDVNYHGSVYDRGQEMCIFSSIVFSENTFKIQKRQKSEPFTPLLFFFPNPTVHIVTVMTYSTFLYSIVFIQQKFLMNKTLHEYQWFNKQKW